MHTLLLSLLLFAPGDAVWVGLPSIPVELTSGEKILLGDSVNNAFGVPAAKVETEQCHQNIKDQMDGITRAKWMCYVEGAVALSDANYFSADLAGVLKNPKDATLIRRKSTGDAGLTTTQIVDHQAVIQAIWLVPASEVFQVRYYRDEVIRTKVWAVHWPIVRGTFAEYRAARIAEQVTIPVGIEP